MYIRYHYCYGCETWKDMMGGICSSDERQKKYIQNVGSENSL